MAHPAEVCPVSGDRRLVECDRPAERDGRPESRVGAAAAFLIPLLSLAAVWGCGRPEGPRVSAEPARLELVREWLRVDLTRATDWVSYPMEMEFDPATGHLFFQDRDWTTIVEIAPGGNHVRSYGRAGEGPGELGFASGIALDAAHVYALDNGNLKIAVFRRRDGSLAGEFRVETLYRDLVVLKDGRILAMPGRERAVDVLDREGRIVGGFGGRSYLAGSCTSCAMARLPDGRVAVLDGTRPELFVFAEGETDPTWIDLYSMPLMERWREELAAQLRRLERMGGGRLWLGDQLDAAGPSHVIMAAAPPGIMETGKELWLLEVDTGDVERYDYGEPLIGYRLAVDWPRIFTSHIEEARILEYRAPERPRR